MLKKLLLTLLILAIIGGIIALVHHIRAAQRNKKELAKFAQEAPYTANLGKVLIIYYSWTGHTQSIADQLATLTQADTYRIQTQEEFKSSPAFYARVKKELNNKIYPALSGHLPDVSNYDVVFVGAPVWWYTMATPLYSFLSQIDFKNKKVIPFSTQGSNPALFCKILRQMPKMLK